jgi:diacylglycerol kinase (ATP)
MIIRKSGLADLIAALHDYNFRDITENRIIRYVQAEKIVIDCDQEMIYDVDGDEGSTFPVEIECLPGAVSLLTKERKAE